MKRTISILNLVVVALTTIAPAARAHGPDHEEHRYRATYRQYDAGFHRQMRRIDGSYYEENHVECKKEYNGGWYSTTCYDVQPDEYVYIREQIIDENRTRVTVYRNEKDIDEKKDPFVEYYVEHDVVIRRHYWQNGYYHEDYVTERYVTTEWAINWDSGWGKIIGGFEVGVLGAEVIGNGKDAASNVLGIGLLASASVSSVAGAIQLKNESDLQKSIAAEAKAEQTATTKGL